MLKLAKRRGSSSFYARGAYLGERVFESLGTRDRGEAERLLATLQNGIFERQARGGVQPVDGDMPIDRIDQQAIDCAAAAIYPACSPATRNRKVHTPTSAILKFAGVTRNIRRPKAPPGIVRWLTQDEARRLVAACSPHLRPLVMFLLHTGARIGEALWLDWRWELLSEKRHEKQRLRGANRNLAKVGVEGSNPFALSKKINDLTKFIECQPPASIGARHCASRRCEERCRS
jgi:integrase